MSESWKHRWISHPHPVIVGALLAISLFFLWQNTPTPGNITDNNLLTTLAQGTVTKIVSEENVPPSPAMRTTRIQEMVVQLDNGKIVQVHNDFTPLSPGARIYLNVSLGGTPDESYTILDYKRVTGLWWLVGIFVALVVAVSGFKKGVYALVGMVLSVAVIFAYVIPALLGGADALTIGLIASAMILVGTFYVSYGFNRMSLTALVGIGVTLVLVGLVGRYTVSALHFTGFADETVIYLNQTTNNGVDLVGIVLAGIVIAAIGVLDDVAVTQASLVFELAHASSARGWKLFEHAMRVGTDHISAVINTLVLAYAGAALPLIMLLHLSNFPLGFMLGGEQIAEEIVRTLVSSMGLVLAVPLSTAVAVLTVSRWGAGASSGHHH